MFTYPDDLVKGNRGSQFAAQNAPSAARGEFSLVPTASPHNIVC